MLKKNKFDSNKMEIGVTEINNELRISSSCEQLKKTKW